MPDKSEYFMAGHQLFLPAAFFFEELFITGFAGFLGRRAP
jgi:hypothetical protein